MDLERLEQFDFHSLSEEEYIYVRDELEKALEEVFDHRLHITSGRTYICKRCGETIVWFPHLFSYANFEDELQMIKAHCACTEKK